MARAKRYTAGYEKDRLGFAHSLELCESPIGEYVRVQDYTSVEQLASQHGWNPDGEQTACEFLAAFMNELTAQFHAAQDLHATVKREVARLKREAEAARRALLDCGRAYCDEAPDEDVELLAEKQVSEWIEHCARQLDAEQKGAKQ